MLSNSLILLSTMAFCLTALSVLLSESQQSRLVDWNVRAWAAIDGLREHLKTKRLFKIVLEEPPPSTALGTVACFVGRLVSISLFGGFCVLGTCAFLGAILYHQDAPSLEPRTACLIWLYGAIVLTGLFGLFESIRMYLWSVCAVLAASVLVSLLIVEFFVRRIAEHPKGPIIALGLLAAATISLLKALA
jgi:hypothetical protein